MKIGIFTYFGKSNFGVNMQAFAVYSIIRSINKDAMVEVIRITSDVKSEILFPYNNHLDIRAYYYDYIRIKKYYSFWKKMNYSKKKYIWKYNTAIKVIKKMKYDVIVVGSDTVLEFKKHNMNKNIPYYWLSPDINAKKILFAPSLKNISYECLSDVQKLKINQCIDSFLMLSARDEATYNFMYKAVKINIGKIRKIFDPTFIFRKEDFSCCGYMKKRNIDLNKKKVLIHLYKNELFEEALVEKIKKMGYLVCSLRPSKYADYSFNDIGPLEQAAIYRYFDFVITHRFHDSVFCFINNVPVVAYFSFQEHCNKYGESKYSSMFKRFGLDCGLINKDNLINADKIIDSVAMVMERYKVQNINRILCEIRSDLSMYIDEVANLIV